MVVAAVGRTKDKAGRSSYSGDGLNLASFRESSELEFGADDAFMLVADDKDSNRVTLRHLKARHSEPLDVLLHFDRRCQRFEPPEGTSKPDGKTAGKLHSALLQLWNDTPPAAADGGADE